MIKDNYGDDVIARFADLLIFIAPSYLCLCAVVKHQREFKTTSNVNKNRAAPRTLLLVSDSPACLVIR